MHVNVLGLAMASYRNILPTLCNFFLKFGIWRLKLGTVLDPDAEIVKLDSDLMLNLLALCKIHALVEHKFPIQPVVTFKGVLVETVDACTLETHDLAKRRSSSSIAQSMSGGGERRTKANERRRMFGDAGAREPGARVHCLLRLAAFCPSRGFVTVGAT